MNFFEAQDDARRQTKWLVSLYLLCVAFLIVAVYCLLLGAGWTFLSVQSDSELQNFIGVDSWYQPQLLMYVSAGVVCMVLLGTLFKMLVLRGGGESVATSMGGVLIDPGTTDHDERVLLNVVQEMAIAAGMSVPDVYKMPDESINAFAAGLTTDDAVIGITQGTINRLTREQLQGVVAHEFSHILNGDMRLNMRLTGVVFGILVLSKIGQGLIYSSARRSARFHRSESNGGLAPIIIGLGLVIIGSIGAAMGSMIRAAVGRQREYLADASAVQFTRNPAGIGGALAQIGAHTSEIDSAPVGEFSHFYISSAVSGLDELFASHPPLEERIARVWPEWDGTIETKAQSADEPDPTAKSDDRSKIVDTILTAAAAGAAIGTMNSAAIESSHQVVASQLAQEATKDGYSARALIHAVLIAQSDADQAQQQLDWLQLHAPQPVYQTAVSLHEKAKTVPAIERLGLVRMCLPALRGMSTEQYQVFKDNMSKIIRMDDHVDLLEWCVEQIILHGMAVHYGEAQVRGQATQPDIGILLSWLSAVACPGNQDQAQQLFNETLKNHNDLPQKLAFVVDKNLPDLDVMARLVGRIGNSLPTRKAKLVEAMADISLNGSNEPEDALVLLNAVCGLIGCPMPPKLAGSAN